jgi:hypothetical protein
MTEQFALLYLPKRAAALGFTDYWLKFRHLVLQPQEERQFDTGHQIYFLTEEPDLIRVESDSGVFDNSETNANELTYEHSGTVIIKNQSPFVQHVRFIQLIPNYN